MVELLDEEKAHRVLAHIPAEEVAELQELRQHGPDTAGGLMNSELLYAPEDLQVWELEAHIRNQHVPQEMLSYVYVVDNERDRKLIGVVDLRAIITAPAEARLGSFMTTDLVTVKPETDQEEVVRLVDTYDLVAVPVVAESGKLLGIVTVDDVIDAIQEEHTEDLSVMAGTSAADLLSTSSLKVATPRSWGRWCRRRSSGSWGTRC